MTKKRESDSNAALVMAIWPSQSWGRVTNGSWVSQDPNMIDVLVYVSRFEMKQVT